MPNKDCHLAMARRNQELIDTLVRGGLTHPEWVSVVAFYKALHVVDAVLFVDHSVRHGGSHVDRGRLLKTTNRYHHIYKHYRPLYSASLVARYLEVDSREFRCFADYMTPIDVRDTLLNHNLRQLEKSAENFLGPLTAPVVAPAETPSDLT